MFLLSFYDQNCISTIRYISALDEEGRSCRDRCIPWVALVDPSVSPWVKVCCCGSETAMITFTGLDYPSFNFLSVGFEVWYKMYTPYSSNGKIVLRQQQAHSCRPRSLDSPGCLALGLHTPERGVPHLYCACCLVLWEQQHHYSFVL